MKPIGTKKQRQKQGEKEGGKRKGKFQSGLTQM
jgi:hypothetical protein